VRFARSRAAFDRYETVKETGVEPDCGASVTMRFITPIPLSRAARRTTLPDGALTAVGSVHVELPAQRAVMPTTRTGLAELTFSVQPFPLPLPSETVTGTCVVPATVVGADFMTSFPGTNVSLTMIVPAPAGPARKRAARTVSEMRRNTYAYCFPTERPAIPVCAASACRSCAGPIPRTGERRLG
jgi:hypothetical protein